MKRCPTCGATATDEDVFCEADGARLDLVASSSEVSPPSRRPSLRSGAGRPCAACGLADADSGDGYCSSCGHRLGPMSTTPPVPSGSTVIGHEVVAPRGHDDFLAKAPDGSLCALVLGEPAVLAVEADALGRLGRVEGMRAFPRLLRRTEDPDFGTVLVLSAPDGKRRVADAARALTVPDVLTLLRGVVETARAIFGAGFSWAPAPDDLYLSDDGGLLLSRARCSPGAGTDVRSVLETVGALLLPLPAALAPTRLLRMLAPRSPPQVPPPLPVDVALADLVRVAAEIGGAPEAGPGLAELCDPGLRRDHNEDATAVAQGQLGAERWTVLVVCDGVSSSTHADRASKIASRTTRDALAHFMRSGDVAWEGAQSALAAALRAAHVAVCATPIDEPAAGYADAEPVPPGTTIVAALVFRRRIVVGWVGDSRAYWVTASGAELLTRDHSWVNETVAKGEMTEAEALAAPLAHALTRCLGPLEVGGEKIEIVEPEVRVRDLPGAGTIILCTDGLWNYYPSAAEVASVVQAAGPNVGAGLLARCLVNHALSQGGGDNVSVAVYQHPGT